MDKPDVRVPVTLLTGFLGAGKTTLLDRLLRDPDAGRIAVVMNELGDVGLDHDLIEAATDETVLMRPGCLCCSIRGDLARTLASLMARRLRGLLSFERVVIETTGIAEPGPILQTLALDEVIAPHYRMDGVVTVVDAALGPRTLDAQVEAVNQIAVADLIVLSKTDLVAPAELGRFEARLADINSTARRVRAHRGEVEGASLLGLSAVRPDAGAQDVTDWLGIATRRPDPLAGISGVSGASTPSAPLPAAGARRNHDGRIGSASIELEDPIRAGVLDVWVDRLVALKGPHLLRVKGIVHEAGAEWPFVLHGVQHVFDAPVPLKSWSGEDRTSRIVVIARDMDPSEIAACLDLLRMRPADGEAPVEGTMTQATGTPC
jgi:G3E family GTPase